MKKLLLIIFSLCFFTAYSQVSITNNNALVENFDGLGTAGTAHLTNWSGVRYAGSGTIDGSLDPIVTNGSASSGAVYNVGTTSATDRALGLLASGSTVPRFGVAFRNNTGALVKSVILSGFMEQWRTGNNVIVETLTFEYSTNATSVNDGAATWISLAGMDLVEKLIADNTNAAVDGNLTANRTAINGFVNIDIVNTSTFYIRWSDANDAGSDGIYAIDDLSITFSTTLPISLTSFTGKLVDQSVLLNWATASESNNDYFKVLKSNNGKTFSSIGTVKGSGTTTDAKSYSFVDVNPAAGTNYYQLVQYDFDGKSSSSSIIPVNSAIANSSLTVYAATTSVNVSINSANQTDGTLQIFDITGKKLNETRLSLTKGFNTLSLPLSLNSGIHVVNFVTGAEVISSKFIKE
jgi:hypothetical protein